MKSPGGPLLNINVSDLRVCYGDVTALSIDKLDVSGNVIALVGHNGSGKSTFIKTLLDLVSISSGTLKTSIADKLLVPENDMAFSPEAGAIFSDISVEDYLKLWCRIKCKSSTYYLEEGRPIIKSLALDEVLGKLGRELSKGQKRRVQIAVCLLINPTLQVFDEPFDGLDIQQAVSLADTVSSTLKNSALLISSHRMDIVERLADTIIILEHGRVIASGTPSSIPSQLGCRSFSISLSDDESVTSTLHSHIGQRFPKAVTQRIGNQLHIVGIDLTVSKLELTFNSLNLKGHSAVEHKPSLPDAVHARLKSFS